MSTDSNEFVTSTLAKAAVLSHPEVIRLISKYPDAQWNWGVHYGKYDPETATYDTIPAVRGWIFVPEDEEPANPDTKQPANRPVPDLADYATSANAEGYTYETTVERLLLPGVCVVEVRLEATQKFTKDEIRLLKKMGNITKEKVNPRKPRAYTNTVLVCSSR
jgi:hypothetical protein